MMVRHFVIRSVAYVAALVITLFYAVGCGDSAPGTESRKVARNVNESGRLIQASRQQLSLTEQEVDQARLGGTKKRLAEQAVNRIERNADYSEIEQSLAQITQRLEQIKSNDYAADKKEIDDLTHQLMQTSQQFLTRQDQLNAAMQSENTKRLQLAEQKLNQAIEQAGQANNRVAQIAPELMLGTIHLMIARDGRSRIQQTECDIVRERVTLGDAANGVAIEDAFASGIGYYLPQKTITAIESRLEGSPEQTGEPASLVERLGEVDQKISELSEKKQTLNDQIESNRREAEQLYQQYQALIDQAEQSTEPQYELRRQAYHIQAGYQQDETHLDGIIDYEARMESDKAELAAVRVRLDYYQLRRQQLQTIIAKVKDDVEQLKNSPIIDRVQNGRQASHDRRAKWVAVLTQQMESLDQAEKQYSNARLDVVEAFNAARNTYLSAAGKSLGNLKAQQYAKAMSTIATGELAAFWIEDADHYVANIESLNLIEFIPELNSRVSTLRGNFDQQRQDAKNAAERLYNEIQSESSN